MNAAAATRTRLELLVTDLEADLEALEAVANQLRAYFARLDSGDRLVRIGVAFELHAYFGAVESAFERIARVVDGQIPDGADWRRRLVAQMTCPLAELRPAVAGSDLATWLHELRGFRHFFRNAYRGPLDPIRLAAHANGVAVHHAAMLAALGETVAFLRAALAELPPR